MADWLAFAGFGRLSLSWLLVASVGLWLSACFDEGKKGRRANLMHKRRVFLKEGHDFGTAAPVEQQGNYLKAHAMYSSKNTCMSLL